METKDDLENWRLFRAFMSIKDPDLLPCLPSFISRLCSGFGPCRGGLRTRSA
jgi:hypothetical protein